MTKDKKGGGQGEDEHLWEVVTRDVKPLSAKKKSSAIQDSKKPPAPKKPKREIVPAPVRSSPPKTAQMPQLDGRTDARLRKGKISIDARLDLHGHTQDSALGRLTDFVISSSRRKYRCILVITGKGRTGQGILRERLPLWLSMPSLKPLIIKYVPAALKDGGSGAFYIYLKRDRGD